MHDTLDYAGFADPIASMSHLFAAPIALVFGFLLWRRGRGEGWRTASLVVYSIGIVLLLTLSGTYHLLPVGGTARLVLRHLDHASIWILIAGTFTPVHVIALRGFWRWGMLSIIWGIAVTGITLESIWLEEIPGWLASTFYLCLGWIGALSAWQVAKLRNARVVLDCIYGGIAYSIGATFEAVGSPTLVPGYFGPHELFHVGVLIGICYHARFVWRFAKESTFGEALRHPAPVAAALSPQRPSAPPLTAPRPARG